MKFKPAAVSAPFNTQLRAVKCYDPFGGPEMWNIQYKRDDGFWVDIQWMSRGNAERVVGPLPAFKLFRGKVVPVKKD